MRTALRILNEEFHIDGAPDELRRLQDLAAALEARLDGFSGDGIAGGDHACRRLALAALALLDEAQSANAALARARCEIERLHDIVAEAAPLSLDIGGRVNVMRA